jgi:hypothetical protein
MKVNKSISIDFKIAEIIEKEAILQDRNFSSMVSHMVKFYISSIRDSEGEELENTIKNSN